MLCAPAHIVGPGLLLHLHGRYWLGPQSTYDFGSRSGLGSSEVADRTCCISADISEAALDKDTIW